MRAVLITFVFLSACSSQDEGWVAFEEMMMDQIEAEVELPQKASKLAQYARYYAFDDGRVIATYTTHVEHGRTGYDLQVGQRRWLSDQGQLPVILDGGCSVVNVVYDSERARAERVFCNGVS